MNRLLTSAGVPIVVVLMSAVAAHGAEPAAPAGVRTEDGYRGLWYMNQPQPDEFKYKYSGGLGTYPQQHIPLAVYAPQVNKTFFCYGGKAAGKDHILNMVSYYDHATGTVPRPVALLERSTNDTHYNPTLALDNAGHVYIFCNSHGTGYELSKDDPTHGKSFVYRSTKPHAIDAFERVREDNFSYSQVWPVKGQSLLWLHTRYQNNRRRIFFSTSADGRAWAEPRQMTNIRQGSYQISGSDGDRVATAIDYHPDKGGLNARTNIYYLETRDFGKTWRTVTGEAVDLPLTEPRNAALVHDFEAEKLLVYLKDLAFDATGRPVILYVTAKSHKSGPAGGPRAWHTARWTGSAWERREVTPADHNYDHGSLHVEPDGAWRLIAPTEPGPQPHSTGGQITVHLSRDEGKTWQRATTLAPQNNRNQTYVRRPLNAHDDFYALWADGDALAPSESDLYFATKAGAAYRLPRQMTGDTAKPERVGE